MLSNVKIKMFELTCVVWFLMPTMIFAFTYEDVRDLKAALINESRYVSSTRPVYNQSDVIFVEVSLKVLTILGLDEVTESLTTTAWLHTTWIDEYLAWEPEEYGGVDELKLPQNLVWKPDLALTNSLQPYKPLGEVSLLLHVDKNGEVRWVPMEVFLSTCSIDITKFPLDVHTCSLHIGAVSYDYEIDILAGDVNIDGLEPNHAWDVIATDSISYYDGPVATFQITLRRKPSYNMLTLVLPIISLYILNLFAFVLPSDSGEKSGYAVTVFLAFTVFLTVIDSSFPHNSDVVSYFAIFVIGGTVQSIIITIIVLIMVRCSSYDNDPQRSVPSWLVALVRVRKFHGCKSNASTARVGIATRSPSPVSMNAERPMPDDAEERDKVATVEVSYTWKYCIDNLDDVFLCLFTVSFMMFAIIYFVKIYE